MSPSAYDGGQTASRAHRGGLHASDRQPHQPGDDDQGRLLDPELEPPEVGQAHQDDQGRGDVDALWASPLLTPRGFATREEERQSP